MRPNYPPDIEPRFIFLRLKKAGAKLLLFPAIVRSFIMTEIIGTHGKITSEFQRFFPVKRLRLN
jgi:hypothetical protein